MQNHSVDTPNAETVAPAIPTPESVEIPCTIQRVVLTDTKNGRVVTVPVHKCYTAPTAEQYAAAAAKHPEPLLLDKISVPISEHELIIGTVAGTDKIGLSLILLYDPEYSALGIVRQDTAEQDTADVTAVYNALMMQGEQSAFRRNDKRVEIVPEDDPRAATFVFDPMYSQIVYRVRESDRRNDVRRISKKLRDKYAYLTAPTSTTEGGTTDAK